MRPEHKEIFEALSDAQLMGLCIEREAGGEPVEGKIAVGTVILERVDHRKWDGDTIKGVILMPWQFSWTMPEAGEAYYREAVDMALHISERTGKFMLQKCVEIAEGMLAGTIPRDPDLAAVNCCQYLNPKAAAKTKKKWLAAGMKVIKAIANHEFFREG